MCLAIDFRMCILIIMSMTYDDVIAHFGSQQAAADALDISQPSISDWKRSERIPHIRQLQIEHVTDGKLKADELPFKSRTAEQTA